VGWNEQNVVEGQRFLDDAHLFPWAQKRIIRTLPQLPKSGAFRRHPTRVLATVSKGGLHSAIVMASRPMNMRRSLPLLLLVPILASGAASAQVTMYKWTDENGRVTYSDQPPLGKVRSKETINIPGATNPNAARQVTDADAQFKKRQDDAAKAQAATAKKEEAEKQKQDNCSRARNELRALRDNQPLVRLTEKGERILLDEGAREAEGKRIETYIEENCAQTG
jgi:hypothetical protein